MKDELGGKIMKKFIGLRAKTYSYLIDDGSEDKKAKGTKNCVKKRKRNNEDCKNYLEATQLKNKINHLDKNEIDAIVLKNITEKKKLTKINKLTLKAQQRLTSERHNIFNEFVNKMALSSNDDIRMQPIDSAETYAYGISKDLVSKKKKLSATI